MGGALLSIVPSVTTDQMAWGMIASGAVAGAVLFAGVTAPYGRYSSEGWGPLIPARLAWLTQEIWSLAVPVVWLSLYATKEQLRIVPGRPTPVAVWCSAAFFCIFNGYMQTRYLLEEAPPGALTTRHVIGIMLWAVGFAINIQSDTLLINQRRAKKKKKKSDDEGLGKTDYSIPRGGLFQYISCANYFGEVVEWVGWAVASASLPAMAFAFFTIANLAPRALQHHKWYKKTFKGDYPSTRKAIIPFIF